MRDYKEISGASSERNMPEFKSESLSRRGDGAELGKALRNLETGHLMPSDTSNEQQWAMSFAVSLLKCP